MFQEFSLINCKPFLLLFCLILCLVWANSGSPAKIEDTIFKQYIRYYTGNGTLSVTGGDLDGDGDIDLATANLKTSEVSVFINKGNGGFSGGSKYAVSNGPLAMQTGDLDGDGDVDLAVLCFSASKISILLNRGTSSLTVAASYDIAGSPSDLCIGDFNSDGKLDLATANSNSADLALLLNKGKGVFGKGARIALPEKPFRILCGDFNGDSKTDLAAVSGNHLYVLINSGSNPYFADQKPYNAGRGIQAIAAGNFNADGSMDLGIFLNKGNGEFQGQSGLKAGESPHFLAVVDVDRDSKSDLVAANRKSKDLSVFINLGGGKFGREIRYDLRTEPSAMYAADLDSDGEVADLAVVSTSSGDLAILIGTYGKKP
jgi:hypothetical protein